MSSMPPERLQRAAFGTTTGELASGLLAKVFGLLAFSFAASGVGGLVGYRLSPSWFLPLVFVEFGLIFAVQRMREREGWNVALLYTFTFVSGMTLGPIIAAYAGAGLGLVVLQAAGITAAMTVGLSFYALGTKRDLSGLQTYVFLGLLGLIVASVANIWVGGSALYALLSWGGALLFSVLLVFDVNRTRRTADTMGNAVVIALGIYLDIVNLFLFILRILSGSRR
jgi:FtsH-binding integral membrane protein